jgi:hypothetical protein
MLTGFYHRSVLRCGCLAERKSGVAHILSAALGRKKICVAAVANRITQAARLHKSQSIGSGNSWNHCKPSEGMLG